MAVARLCAEFDSIPKFLAESEKLTGDVHVLKAAQAVSMDAKLKSLKSLSIEDATSMKQSIRSVGWEKVDVDRLSKSVDDAVCRSADTGLRGRRGSQHCAKWEFYPTQEDWVYMSDGPTPWSLKFDRAAAVCKQIGLTLPNEKTRGRILEALLAANNVPLERDKDFFKLLERLRQALGRLRHPAKGKHIAEFPLSPLDLPKDIFAQIYPAAQPSMREFPAIGEMTKDFRKSSNAYKKAHEPLTLHLSPSPCRETSMQATRPTGSPMDACMAISQSLGQSKVDPWRAMACLMLGASEMQAQAPFHSSSSLPALKDMSGFPMPPQLEDSANAIMDQAIEEEDQEVAEGGKDGGRGKASSQQSGMSPMSGSRGSPRTNDGDSGCPQPDIDPADADAEMRAALAKRVFLKKPASARKRRHEAAGAREACAQGSVQGVVKGKTIEFLPLDKRRSKHEFCSKWYHRLRNELRREGRSKAKIEEAIDGVYAAAGKVWDLHMA